jgi:hypothetical protein
LLKRSWSCWTLPRSPTVSPAGRVAPGAKVTVGGGLPAGPVSGADQVTNAATSPNAARQAAQTTPGRGGSRPALTQRGEDRSAQRPQVDPQSGQQWPGGALVASGSPTWAMMRRCRRDPRGLSAGSRASSTTPSSTCSGPTSSCRAR